MNKLPTLEQRIAAALTSTDITSRDLATLIAEVEAAAQAADEDAIKARARALDPAVVVDVASVGAAVATATLARDRLQAALPRLQERLNEVREREDLAAWKAEAEELEARRIAKMTEFADFYPPMYERIVDHLYSMRALDREIDDLNRRRPNGSVRALEYSTPAFTVDLKIPDPYNKDQPLWPPLQLTPSQQLARAMLANPDAYTDRFVVSEAAAGTYIEARNRRVLEDNRRQIAEAERSQREREQREAAEMAKIKEADHMAVSPAEKQEMQMPDDNPYYAPMRPEPSKERLNAPSSRVIVKNTSEVQNHIVIDRFNVGHELRPGEAREMEILNLEIANFQEQRRPDRFYPTNDPTKPGRPKPLHPIVIEGIGPIPLIGKGYE